MVSDTKKTERRRRMKQATVGRAQKRERAKSSTPKFPIDPAAPSSAKS